MTEQTQPSRSSVLKAVDGKHHASVQILVEVVCKVDSTGLGSTHHDQSKYDHYFDQVVAGLSGMVTSPLDPKHTIDVSVDKVSTAAAAPAAPFVGGPNGNGSRLGAFEVYLCTDLVDVETVPPCSGLHSKLHSRHWPNIKQLQARCNDVLLRVFHRWKRDVELRAAIPHIVEASDAEKFVEAYLHKASPGLLAVVIEMMHTLQAADQALATAMTPQTDATEPQEFDAAWIPPLHQAIEDHGAHASPSVLAAAETCLTSWIATRTANDALRTAPAVQEEVRKALIQGRAAKASVKCIEQAEARLRVLETADNALNEAIRSAVVKDLRLAIPMHRDHASPGVVSDAQATLAHLEAKADSELRAELADALDVSSIRALCMAALARMQADAALISTPSDQAELRFALECNKSASSKTIAQAEARLQALVMADAALNEAIETSVTKDLRIAILEHYNQASPGVASASKAYLAQLEAEADAGLRAGLAAATEAITVRELSEQYAERATAPVLAEAAAALNALDAADLALTIAMGDDYDPELIGPLEEEFQRQSSSASASIVTEARFKLESWKAIFSANSILRAAPNSAIELRQLIAEFGSIALPAVVEEARTRLDRLAISDAALEEACHVSIPALRAALPEHGPHATRIVSERAKAALAEQERKADAVLRASVAQEREQSALRELINKYLDQATQPALDEAAARLKVIEEVDAAIRDTVFKYTEEEPKPLKSSLTMVEEVIDANKDRASPSVVISAQHALLEKRKRLNADANQALVTAPADYDELLDAIDANKEHGSPEVLTVALVVLKLLTPIAELQSAVDVLKISALSGGIAKVSFVNERYDFGTFHKIDGRAGKAIKERKLRALNDAIIAVKTALNFLDVEERVYTMNSYAVAIDAPQDELTSAREARSRAAEAQRAADEVLADHVVQPPKWTFTSAIAAAQRRMLSSLKELSPRRRMQRHKIKRLLMRAAFAPGGQADLRVAIGSAAFGPPESPMPKRLMGQSIWDGDRMCKLPYGWLQRTELIFVEWAAFVLRQKRRRAEEYERKLAEAEAARKAQEKQDPDALLPGWSSRVVFVHESGQTALELPLVALKPEQQPEPEPEQEYERKSSEAEAAKEAQEKEKQDPDALPLGWSSQVMFVHESGQTALEPPLLSPKPERKLPEGWQQFVDPTSRMPYYVELKTLRTTWKRPTEERLWLERNFIEWRNLVRRIKEESMRKMEELLLPAGWTEFYDKKTSSFYYVSDEGETTTTRPREATEKARKEQEEEERIIQMKNAADERRRLLREAQRAKEIRKKQRKAAEAENKLRKAREVQDKKRQQELAAQAKKEAEAKAKAEVEAAAQRAAEEAAAAAEHERLAELKAQEDALAAKAKAEAAEAAKSLNLPWAYNTEETPMDNIRTWLAFHKAGSKDLFNKWDVDRNGLISKTDFRKAVPVWSGNLMTHAQMELLFNQLDDDGSEAIDFKELDRKIKGRSYSIDPDAAKTPGYEKLMKLMKVHAKLIIDSFSKWDTNKNGAISKAEFRQMIPRLIEPSLQAREPDSGAASLSDVVTAGGRPNVHIDGEEDLASAQPQAMRSPDQAVSTPEL
ncbi:hypothetical protein Ctob_001398 [Chrysochromulina tobinii]|uniref:Uncharacterized protein n=1 Tax=Chrysochromulina tobinii TaxID=1460289 RepID=A0A0M0JGY0_9EUKA|nr:hypothetical protein Ctob_001398 [Chrysochromulina tobinii]|eukprot:KOO25871.1 hypothetical protein Ctob_001398 [Chrysochromulina sp. CCMP291]